MIINVENNYNGPVTSIINNIFSPVNSGEIIYINTGSSSGTGIVINSGVSLGDYEILNQSNISGEFTGVILSKYTNTSLWLSSSVPFNFQADTLENVGINSIGFGAIIFDNIILANNIISFPNLTGNLYSAYTFNNIVNSIAINFSQLKECSKIEFSNSNFSSLNLDSLEKNYRISMQNIQGITSLNLPNLKDASTIIIDENSSITEISFPNLTGWRFNDEFAGDGSISISSSLSQESVDSILNILLQTNPTQGNISLIGLCSPPSEVGLTYVSALQGLGVTVTTNL